MRFYYVVAVAAGLAAVLGGCSFSSESSVEANASISTDGTTDDEEQDVADEEQDASEKVEVDNLYVGTVDGDTYTNEYLGIRMVVPEGFTPLAEEELAEQCNNGVMPTDDGDGAYVTCGAGESYIDAYLAGEGDEAIAVSVSYLGSDFDLDPNSEEYLDTLRKNAIEAQGDATVEWGQGTFELGDYTFPMIKMAVDDGSGTVTHREMLCLVLNGYSVNVEAISPDEESLNALLSGVTLLNQ